MGRKETLLNEIVQNYLESGDFNGLHYKSMEDYYGFVCDLIDDGLVTVISETDVLNPHIYAFPLNLTAKHQKQTLASNSYSVLYPTEMALENVTVDHDRPYTAMMQRGKKQFDIVYFNIEILERYANNPQFYIFDNGYRGSISPKDDFYDDPNIKGEYIKDYGMAYIDDEILKRAVGVFVCDLSKLTGKKQMLWKGFELPDQSSCKINAGFIENLVLGKWVTVHWIFHALIDEMIVINKQCARIGIPTLFNKTFGIQYFEMPEGYRNILLPTLKNFYDFVLVLEKMVIHNLSIKTFQEVAPYIKTIDRNDEAGKEKGSLTMLEEWLKKNISGNDSIREVVIKPLRGLRTIRQKPAHELTSNKYDVHLYQRQADLVHDVYTAIRALRLLFAGHPLTQDIEIPEYLLLGKDIVSY